MASGKVKWFDANKGFGFIQPDEGGPDAFVHITAVQAAGLKTLNDGQRVTYELTTQRGRTAVIDLRLA
jgi:cold shock protein